MVRKSVFLFGLIFAFYYAAFCQPNIKIKGIHHVILLGQSLGAGEESLPLVTNSSNSFGNLRFKIGTHTWTKKYYEGQPRLRSNRHFIFVPLTSVVRGHEGETIGSGLCDHLKNSSEKFVEQDAHFLFSFTGQGGRYLRELDKKHDDAKDPRAGARRSGGGYYNTVIDDVKRAKLMAKKTGKPYSVLAIAWMQGESNLSGHINRWDPPISPKEKFMEIYTEDFINLKRDLQTDIMAITNQTDSVKLFTYQTAGASIGTAQLNACDEENDIYMVSPIYMLPSAVNSKVWVTQIHGNPIHLAADGQRWLGEMFAKVIRKVVFEKQNWSPLRPIEAVLSEDMQKIHVKFHVPYPPLVLDTTFLPKQGNSFGFQVYNGGNLNKISSVSVIKDSIIEINLMDRIDSSKAFYVSYGLQLYVREVSKPIFKISPMYLVKNVPHFKIEYEGDVLKEFDVIAKEGAFRLSNRPDDFKDLTSVYIRKVYLNEAGNTVLVAEKGDLRNNVPFKVGQKSIITRVNNYGNLHDSDPEESTFTFKDKTYGNRAGQKYPLFNWAIVFEDLLIKSN